MSSVSCRTQLLHRAVESVFTEGLLRAQLGTDEDPMDTQSALCWLGSLCAQCSSISVRRLVE